MAAPVIAAALKFSNFNLDLAIVIEPQPADGLRFTGRQPVGRLALEIYGESIGLRQKKIARSVARN
jgi:hypothetical protein